jgi:hypothetical protein
MNFAAITQTVRLLGRVLTLSYPVEIQGILKHTTHDLTLNQVTEA